MSTINTLVLSGGAYNGLIELGVLRRLSEKGVFDVKRIHGTSVGGFIAVLLALKMDWGDLIEYFVERPWHKLLSINPIEVYTKKGAFDKQFFISALTPLFAAKGLDVSTISLQEFKEYSGIELYVYAIKLSTFEVCEISSESHPDMLLIDAVTMTCCMPVAFRPVLYKGEYYIDGGIAVNYPLREAISHSPDANADVSKNGDANSKILGITFDLGYNSASINENSNIAEYIYCLFMKISSIREFNNVGFGTIQNEIVIRCAGMNAADGYDALFKRDSRADMVKRGEMIADEWLLSRTTSSSI